MFERFDSPQELFGWQLGTALSMEREIVDMLDELIEEASDSKLEHALREHQGETRGHVSNVEQAFTTLGWEVEDSPAPVLEAIEKEGKSNIKKADDSLVDAVIAGGAIETEHYEMALYENLIVHARALGQDAVAQLLERNLDEERKALETVKGIASELAARAPVGQSAG